VEELQRRKGSIGKTLENPAEVPREVEDEFSGGGEMDFEGIERESQKILIL